MPLKPIPFDGAQYLETPQAEAELLADAASTGDAAYIRHALNTIARARGMTAIASQSGISRRALFEAYLSEESSDTETVLAVFRSLDPGSEVGTASAAE